jgi:hypothetical protein
VQDRLRNKGPGGVYRELGVAGDEGVAVGGVDVDAGIWEEGKEVTAEMSFISGSRSLISLNEAVSLTFCLLGFDVTLD